MNNNDDIARVIMLVYGVMEHGGPFWCYVAVKPSRYDAFKEAETAGTLDLYNFDEFGEIIVSAEGDAPPDHVTKKVAEMYNTDPGSFFQDIDPIAEVEKKAIALRAAQEGQGLLRSTASKPKEILHGSEAKNNLIPKPPPRPRKQNWFQRSLKRLFMRKQKNQVKQQKLSWGTRFDRRD